LYSVVNRVGVIYNLLDVKDYFDTNIIFKEEDGYVSSPTTPTFIGTDIKDNTSMPKGITFILALDVKAHTIAK
ncbi:hypothetical protein ACLBP3_30375, partial [Klebsiella pneumoniae]|uniref:hypothetical protein n=1 Tax=Klebsiella pneumoniae TaxID=573 RepID=UPI00396B7E05